MAKPTPPPSPPPPPVVTADGNARTMVALAGEMLDDTGRSWIEVMPTVANARNGRWLFTVTRDDLDVYAASIRANGDTIPVDYDHAGHPEMGGSTKAAGWFTGEAVVVDAGSVNPRGEAQPHPSVWAQVQWTPAAQQAIRDGEYRFVSPEFTFENRDKKTGLFSKAKAIPAATLTNRPFFKQLAPVLASDVPAVLTARLGDAVAALVVAGMGGDPVETRAAAERVIADVVPAADHNNPGGDMPIAPTAVLERLGLPEDATEEQMLAKLNEQQPAPTEPAQQPAQPEQAPAQPAQPAQPTAPVEQPGPPGPTQNPDETRQPVTPAAPEGPSPAATPNDPQQDARLVANSVYDQLVSDALFGRQMRQQMKVDAALKDTLITPADRDRLLAAMARDEAGTTAFLDRLSPGAFPVGEIGTAPRNDTPDVNRGLPTSWFPELAATAKE